jgi:hypothetical protein
MTAAAAEQFLHARVIIGIVTGLSMARLLIGLAGLIQRPERDGLRGFRLAWAAYLGLAVTQFWWFEVGLPPDGRWDYGLYIFTICYAALFFFTCVVLFPDRADAEDGFAAYFAARRVWFFGLIAALAAGDVAFSALKGPAFVAGLGPAYFARQAAMVGLALLAAARPGGRLPAIFAGLAIAGQVWWILRTFGLAP